MADGNWEYVQNDSLDAGGNTTVTLGNCGEKKKGRAMKARPLFSIGRAAGACARIETLYSGLLMMAQAMRGGAALEAPEATAWITMAVPPLLNTE
jgi:hypothetical protein